MAVIDSAALNPEQYAAVTCTEGPLLLLAGAGTGKTRVLTYRIAHLVRDVGVPPYQILAITFTNKAAAEMRERLSALLGDRARGMWVSTFHAACVRLLRADAERLGFTRDFSIVDDDDSKRIFKEIYAQLGMDPTGKHPLKSVRARISAAKNELLGPIEFSGRAKSPLELACAKVYERLEQSLRLANSMDFDDLLLNAYRLLASNPDVLDAWQERFHYILVDEYQDTNHAQYMVTKLLADKRRNIMVVGDDDQSIYSWRGADIRNILEFEQDYPQANVMRLEQNYRSTTVILDAANAVIANNAHRKGKRLFTEGAKGERISLYQASDEHDEGRWIAAEVERLRRQGRAYSDIALFYRTNAQSRTLEDMLLRAGVPYRIVGTTRFFDRAEIRDLMAYLKLVVNPLDDISARRVINTPRRGIGREAQGKLEAAARESGCAFIQAVEHLAGAAGLTGRQQASLTEFMAIFAQARCYEGSLRSIVEMVAEKAGLLSDGQDSAADPEKRRAALERQGNIREFFGVAEEFDADDALRRQEAGGAEAGAGGGATAGADAGAANGAANGADGGATAGAAAGADGGEPGDAAGEPQPDAGEASGLQKLRRFMDWLALRSDLDTLVEGESAMTLMTVHAAKGLEFPIVFISGMEETIFPHKTAFSESRDVEEERRLAYVAITRARELLYMTHAQSRFLFGDKSAYPPSRFIGEIPEPLISRSGVGSKGVFGTGWEKRGDRRGILGSGNRAFEDVGGRVYGSGMATGAVPVPGLGQDSGRQAAPGRPGGATHVRFDAGDAVDHRVFGPGVVVSADGDKLEIRFERLGAVKKLVASLAPLVKTAHAGGDDAILGNGSGNDASHDASNDASHG
jgi:DNA helicase-2/ATP-dependent DNA helicase PcrA